MKRQLKQVSAAIVIGLVACLLMVLWTPNLLERADYSGYDNSRVLKHLEALTGANMRGRMTGDTGNEAAMDYIETAFKSYGLEPWSETFGYRQPYEVMVPLIELSPELEIHLSNGEVKRYAPYEDYRLYTAGEAGTANYEGEALFVGRYPFKVPQAQLKGRVVVLASIEFSKQIQDYLAESEAAGALVYFDSAYAMPAQESWRMKSTSTRNKQGKTIPIAAISKEMYRDFRDLAAEQPIEITSTFEKGSVFGIVENLSWHCDIDFPIVKTANILGVIPGKSDSVLMVTAHLDHVGQADETGYFPGALDNGSGTAMMLELARLSSLQQAKPDKTLVFVAWNGEEVGITGSAHYVNVPAFPLEQTTVLNLDMIGGINGKKLSIGGITDQDRVLASRMSQYVEALGFETEYSYGGGSDNQSFSAVEVPAIIFNQGFDNYHTQLDDMANIDPKILEDNGKVLSAILESESYKGLSLDYLTQKERLLAALFLVLLLSVYLLERLYRDELLGVKAANALEGIYYHTLTQMVKRILGFATSLLMLLFLLGVITHLPKDFDWIIRKGDVLTNFLPGLTLEKMVLYYRSLLTEGFGTTFRGSSTLSILTSAFSNSGKLLLFSLLLSVPLGILKGLYDVYGGKKRRGLRALSSLLLISIPDILWIMLAFFLTVQIGQMDLPIPWLKAAYLRKWMMPLLTLSILPVIYISRITLVAAEHELGKFYVRALRAKGLSKLRMFTHHLLRPVLIKVFESLASVTTIMISNLIMIEFLFDYKGIVNAITVYSKNDDTHTFVGLVLSLGVLFILCLGTFKVISFLINPRKQEVQS